MKQRLKGGSATTGWERRPGLNDSGYARWGTDENVLFSQRRFTECTGWSSQMFPKDLNQSSIPLFVFLGIVNIVYTTYPEDIRAPNLSGIPWTARGSPYGCCKE